MDVSTFGTGRRPPMYCRRCHAELPDGANFCPNCGKKQPNTEAPVNKTRHRRRRKGTGTVYKVSGNRARPWAAVTGGGKLLGYFAESCDAVNALDTYNANALPDDRALWTFEDVYDGWRPDHFKTIEKKSQQSYSNAYNTAKALHHRRFSDLKTDDYQKIIDQLEANGKSRSLCEKQRQLFSQLCDYAMSLDIIDKNYSKFLKLKSAEETEKRIFTDSEISRIAAMTTDKRLGEIAKITVVLICTGLRINELLMTRTENVHLKERYFVTGEKTEAGKNRAVPIDKSAYPYFVEWMTGNNSEWLLPSAKGGPRDQNNIRKSFNSLMKKLGIEGATLHSTRHTAASRWAKQKVNPEITKKFLGHADISTTLNIYTHTDLPQILAAADTIPPIAPLSKQ